LIAEAATSHHDKSPGACSGAFSLRVFQLPSLQVRVRIRIMKLSKLSSATCIHINESLRYAIRL